MNKATYWGRNDSIRMTVLNMLPVPQYLVRFGSGMKHDYNYMQDCEKKSSTGNISLLVVTKNHQRDLNPGHIWKIQNRAGSSPCTSTG